MARRQHAKLTKRRGAISKFFFPENKWRNRKKQKSQDIVLFVQFLIVFSKMC
jgi:hypothetical protein